MSGEDSMLHGLLNQASARFDEAMSAAIFHRSARARSRSRSESLDHGGRMEALERVTALYDRPEHYDPGAPFFPAPSPIKPVAAPVRAVPGGSVADWRWPSPFAPHSDEIADWYLSHGENRLAAARLFLHEDRPRPAVLLLHGYRAGQWALEERVWPIQWLFDKGLDVALPVFPFHAVRSRRGGAPLVPGSDPRMTNEGFRQAVLDVRTLVNHLLERGAPSVGVMGMSLGGYTAALTATVEERLSFAVPIIPLASIARMARDSGRLVGSAGEQRSQFEALEAAYRVVSPLARPARLPRERMLVVGAEGDRITPVEHARLLAAHFGAPLEVFPGGHILQFWRADAFRAVGRLLGRLGLFDPAR